MRLAYLWLGALVLTAASQAQADPCGMVPPAFTGKGPAIERIGAQRTYVFYKDGIESFAIRPGFKGQVEDFGMLIPFPSPPALRKLPDEVFKHVGQAADPPYVMALDMAPEADGMPMQQAGGAGAPDEGAVRVLRREAVGMYEVAVLEAGSAQALKRWMDAQGYKYPTGMDGVCQEYVEAGWCFVAVKTRVGRKDRTDPRPGQQQPDPGLKPGETFSGHVQAMGFRFKSDKLVVPMRLSAFNEGALRNVVYVLAEKGLRIDRIPTEFVRRQIPGQELYENLTGLLPGAVPLWAVDRRQKREERLLEAARVARTAWGQEWFERERDPTPHVKHARDLFAGDLLAAKLERLSHPHEELEKRLLGVGEALELRGPQIDRLHEAELAKLRAEVTAKALAEVKSMVLTVIDGDFPREVVANANLTFSAFTMDDKRNNRREYDVAQSRVKPRGERVYLFRGKTAPQLVSEPQ